MEKIRDFEQYKELFGNNKSYIRSGLTNQYLAVADIKRYISRDRLFFDSFSSGVAFYTDEDEYYRIHYIGDGTVESATLKKEKPVLLRYVFTEKSVDERWAAFLEKAGLVKEETSTQIVAKMSEITDADSKLNLSLRYLNRFGLSVEYASESMLDEILRIRNEEPLLSKFYFPYKTREEFEDEIRQGLYRVVINREGEVVAAQHFVVNNGTVSGEWLAVREEYKLKYGIGGAMAYHSFKYAQDHNFELYYGWVNIENSNSLSYHKTVGYGTTGKMASSWIGESEYE